MTKDIKRKLKKFTRFLKDNNCFNEYFRNYDEDFAMLSFINLLGSDYYDLFFSAFNWYEVKEGVEFWEEINDEWRRKIKTM